MKFYVNYSSATLHRLRIILSVYSSKQIITNLYYCVILLPKCVVMVPTGS